ncbi:cyclopentanol dehydrogenase [Devosia subaequoris]|uniref:Cyclopentanol dehydrogenase n=1 Tax=Devosia subaequoris TaxID=395930 RepID=A0A7W6IQI0_9HYPH|nr:SDR family oxidoreductase [Devosia subaequoris]MBB4053940.1 cyclopentanol dehydrogenase [Devosia subaequoris]MCP1211444.1 SDR family oxidoreductase [Devosia subaequoris]
MTHDFTDQIILVTGAGDGIGRAAARQFAERGGTLVLIDIKGVPEVEAELAARGSAVLGVTMDVRDATAWSNLVADLLARFGRIDVLVNNAGIALPGDSVIDGTDDMWEQIMSINAKGVWLGMQAVLPAMVAAGRGKICNVASTAAHIGLRDAAIYCASKGAVLALTRQAGVQYAPDNIQINSVSPGTTMTGIQRTVTDAQRAAFLPLTPIGRFARSEEVAETIVFLCSGGSSFITGADLSVDGGMVAL